MKISIKEVVDDLINEFELTNTFENPFINKGKLRLKLLSKLSNSKNPIDELHSIIDDSISELVTESIDDTLKSLIEKNLIETGDDNGEITYKLKQ